MEQIIGNLCSLLATVSDMVSSAKKKIRDILLIQCISQVLYGIGAIALKGYSAAVQNSVSILRNLAVVFRINSKILECGFVILAVVLGLWFNNLGVLGLLPVISNLEYSIAVFMFKEREVPLKIAFLISVGLYAVFNGAIGNYTGMVTNAALCVAAMMFLIRRIRKQ